MTDKRTSLEDMIGKTDAERERLRYRAKDALREIKRATDLAWRDYADDDEMMQDMDPTLVPIEAVAIYNSCVDRIQSLTQVILVLTASLAVLPAEETGRETQ